MCKHCFNNIDYIVCKLCLKKYDCRTCHDISEKHIFEFSHLICGNCYQSVYNFNDNCQNCKIKYGDYLCKECFIVDEKNIHCDKCDTCFVCDCKKEACVVCFEDLDEFPTISLKCLHDIHTKCFHDLLNHNKYQCPICFKSMIDMRSDFEKLTEFIKSRPYDENIEKDILCNDCLEKSKSFYHPFGTQCLKCKSYNTYI